MTTEEDRQLHGLLDALQIVDEWEQLTGQPSGAWEVQAESDLASDDSMTDPYRVSSSAWAAITAAVSHANCLRDSLFLLQDATHATVRLHTHGQLTLLRGALENASRAVWMLGPSDPDERLRRRLEWAESEAQASVRELNGEAVESKDDRLYGQRAI